MREAILDAGSQPITNLIKDPLPSALGFEWAMTNWGAGGAGTFAYDPAEKAMCGTVTTASAQAAFTMRIGNGSTGNAGSPPRVRVQAGKMYYQSIEVMSSIDDGRNMAIDWYDAAGNPIGAINLGGNNTNIALPANTWVKFSLAGTAPPGAASASVCIIFAGSSGTNQARARGVGSRMWFRKATFAEVPMSYADGSSPGWKWTGAVNQSYPVGYPYTLESIAGSPLADIVGFGQVVLGLPVSTKPLTIYSIGDRVDLAKAWEGNTGVNMTADGLSVPGPTAFIMSHSGAQTGQTHTRVDTGTTVGFNQAYGGVTSVGRHVYAAVLNSGITNIKTYEDAVQKQDRPVIPNSGIARSNFTVQAPSVTYQPVRALLFEAEHNPATVAQITAWLRASYSTSIEIPQIDGGLQTTTTFSLIYDGGATDEPTGFIFDGGSF